MNQYEEFKKSQAEKIKSCYSDSLEKSGEGSRGGNIIGHTKTGKPIYKHNGFNVKHKDFTSEDHLEAAKLNKEIASEHRSKSKELSSHMSGKVAGDEAKTHDQFASEHEEEAKKKKESKPLSKTDQKEADSFFYGWSVKDHEQAVKTMEALPGQNDVVKRSTAFHKRMVNHLSGQEVKKSEDVSLEKGGVGSGKYNHLHGHQFIHQRQRHTIKKIDDSGVLHTKEGKMFRMSTLQDNGVEFPDKQPTVRAPRPLDMLDYKIRLTELEQEKEKVFRDQENDPEIELEGGRVANSYGTKLNAIDKKIEQLNQKYGVSKNSNEYMTYEEINKISSTFK